VRYVVDYLDCFYEYRFSFLLGSSQLNTSMAMRVLELTDRDRTNLLDIYDDAELYIGLHFIDNKQKMHHKRNYKH
jgi:hypothetical protein